MRSNSKIKVGDRVVFIDENIYKAYTQHKNDKYKSSSDYDIDSSKIKGIIKKISNLVIPDGHYVLYKVRSGVYNGVWLNSNEFERDVQYYRDKRLTKLLK